MKSIASDRLFRFLLRAAIVVGVIAVALYALHMLGGIAQEPVEQEPEPEPENMEQAAEREFFSDTPENGEQGDDARGESTPEPQPRGSPEMEGFEGEEAGPEPPASEQELLEMERDEREALFPDAKPREEEGGNDGE